MGESIQNIKKYRGLFHNVPSAEKVGMSAHGLALDIRKFEIELYWKRTTYFWTIIAAAFAGYFALLTADKVNNGLIFLVSCIGLMLSLGWYLVNRGSKYWQENWELHVDSLENDITGPLFKTTINPKDYCMLKFWSGYPFSVSKINQLISLYITLLWLGLIIKSYLNYLSFNSYSKYFSYHSLMGFTLLFIVILLICGRTKLKNSTIDFYRRDLLDKKQDDEGLTTG